MIDDIRQRLPLTALFAVVLLATGCLFGGDDDEATPTPTPEPTQTATPEPTPEWPPVAQGRVTTSDLNVRTGPGTAYPVIGRLQDGDEVPIAGRWADGEWLAMPGIGWTIFAPEWIDLGTDFESLPAVPDSNSNFEFVGPVHAPETRSGIPVVDEVVAAIIGNDTTGLQQLVAGEAPPPPTPTATATPGETLAPTGTEAPSATETPGAEECTDGIVPAARLGEYMDRIFRSEVPTVARDADGRSPLRLYGVVRGEGDVYVAVFAFEGGEGRQFWINQEGRITQFSLGCSPTLPGNMLRVQMGEPFFWFRPPAPPPLDPL